MSYHFTFSHCSLGSQDKNAEVVCIPFFSGPHFVRTLHHEFICQSWVASWVALIPSLTPFNIIHGTWLPKSAGHKTERALREDGWWHIDQKLLILLTNGKLSKGSWRQLLKPVPFTPPIIQAMSSLPILLTKSSNMGLTQEQKNRFHSGALFSGLQILTSLYRYLGWMNRSLPH